MEPRWPHYPLPPPPHSRMRRIALPAIDRRGGPIVATLITYVVKFTNRRISKQNPKKSLLQLGPETNSL